MVNVNYREVKRKAAVGERIKIVAAEITGGTYVNGESFVVTSLHGEGVRINRKWRDSPDLDAWVLDDEYVVLEPITEPAAPSPLGTSFLQSDPLYAAFRQFVADNADAIRAILPQIEPQLRVAPVKPLTRAEVIAKATADVAELLAENHHEVGGEGAWFTDSDGSTITDRAEFVVNRDKRTVTALLRYVDDNKVWRKGIAKAAPDDVFHAEIGKAIALRRALGLAVPSEYTDAPQPEKARVGAKVSTKRGGADWDTVLTGRLPHKDGGGYGQAWGHTHDSGWLGVDQFDIIDDTDVDYVGSTKGVAA